MKPIHILVIDDETTLCNGCRMVLSEQGHQVNVCMNGHAGLAEALEGDYDIVLLDLKLPDMDGMEILRVTREKKPCLYAIIMTGYATVQSAIRAMKTGAFDFLPKPFSDDELLLAVSRAVDKKRLLEENLTLRRELRDRFSYNNIIGENPKIIQIFEQISKVAPTDSTVLIFGHSGTGKELFARAIYANSRRAGRQFVAMDCSTLSPNLLESELFGHVRGAFTGAVSNKAGLFEAADCGTLFLDDVANLNLEIQAKLLRVLETREYKPVGASHSKKTDVRIIAATNQELWAMVEDGRFREDLFYRLNVFSISLPALKDRKDDIPRLAYHFLRYYCGKTGKRIDRFTDDALKALVSYDWPGNVRQLKNTIERLVILSDRNVLHLLDLLDHLRTRPFSLGDAVPENVEELKALKKRLVDEAYGQIQKAFIIKALDACQGNITRAAERVGMKRPNFSALMKKHGLSVQGSEHSA